MKIEKQFVFVLLALCFFVLPARAAIYTVNTTADNESNGCAVGACTLREAVTDANNQSGGDEIRFNLPVNSEIRLTAGELLISESLIISGPGANILQINGGDSSRVFRVAATANVTINSVTVSKGKATGGLGGAIYNSGSLTLNYVSVSDSVADSSGGAIFNENNANLTLTNCLVARNRSFTSGGGVFVDGGLVSLRNTTFYANEAFQRGGAVYQTRGNLEARSVTIFKNSAYGADVTASSGIAAASGATVLLLNTVVGEGFGNAAAPIVSGSFISLGYNLISNTTGSSGFGNTGDILNVASNLRDLASNGGQTQTCQPNAGSLVINAGSASVQYPIDQRGYGRPADGRGDIGAFEFNAAQVTAIGAPDLLAASDNGFSQTDNLTNSRAPIFEISAPAGTAIELIREGAVVGSGISSSLSSKAAITDANPPANGAANYSARILGTTAATQTLTVTYDTVAPRIAINQAAAQPDPTFNQPIYFTLTADEPVYNFANGLTVGGTAGIANATVTVTANSPTNLTAAVGNLTASGTVVPALSATPPIDAAGNAAAGASADNTVTFNSPDLIVTNTGDSNNSCQPGNCSLREAIKEANNRAAPTTVGFAFASLSAPQTIGLSSQLDVYGNVTVQGFGTNLLRISGSNAVRVFLTFPGASLTLNRLTVTEAAPNNQSGGGAILNIGTVTLNHSAVTNSNLNINNSFVAGGIYNEGTLNLNDSTVSGNSITNFFNSGALAGGILNFGTLNLTRSTVSGNTGDGGSSSVGGILNRGTATIINSTVSGNRAVSQLSNPSLRTGGIHTENGAVTTIVNSTITDNESPAAASSISGIVDFGTTTIRSSIVADNRNSASVPEALGTFASQGYNLIGRNNANGWTTNDSTNLAPGAVRLLPLADNGGATRTHALELNSPAIDRAHPSDFPPTDQRGTARPAGTRADIGAFEYFYDCANANLTAAVSNVIVTAGQPLIFSVSVNSNAPYTIQWQRSADGGATWTNIAGAIGTALNLGNADIYDDYSQRRYRVVITPACGALLTSNAATAIVNPATGGGFQCAALSPKTSAWFRFADNTFDTIGGAINNSVNYAVPYAAGKIGRGLNFTGNGNHVSIPAIPALAPQPQISVEAWVNFSNLNSSTSGGAPAGLQYLVFKKNTRNSNYEGYALHKARGAGGDYFYFTVADRNGLQIRAASTAPIAAGAWYHVVGTFDGAVARVYVNGALAGETTAGAAFAGLDYDNSPLIFGRNNQSYDEFLNGLLDEVKIYGQALTASEVSAAFQADSAGTCLANRWRGTVSSDWANPANWSANQVPLGTAYIFAGGARQPIVSANAAVQNLMLGRGATITVTSSGQLSISGTVNVDGALNVAGGLLFYNGQTGGGAVNYTGTTSQSVLPQTYSNLVISNTNAALNGNLVITNSLNVGDRIINTNENKITLAPGARIIRNSGYIAGRVEKQFGAAANAFEFPVGTVNGYSPVAVSNVAGAGSLTIAANQTAYSGAANGLPANRAARWWAINNNGLASADVRFTYLASDITLGTESNYKLFRIAGGAATNVGGTIDTTNRTIFAAGINQFSDWTLAELAPTSATVTAGGRILDANGRGISKAVVTLIDASGNTRHATTNPFGFYRFADIRAGATYICQVRHKRFEFAPKVLSVTEEIDNLNFTAAQ